MTNQRKWVLIEAHNLMSLHLASASSVAVAAAVAVAVAAASEISIFWMNKHVPLN